MDATARQPLQGPKVDPPAANVRSLPEMLQGLCLLLRTRLIRVHNLHNLRDQQGCCFPMKIDRSSRGLPNKLFRLFSIRKLQIGATRLKYRS